MPIITETVVSSASTNSYESVATNFANAVAAVVGTEAKTASDGSKYVLMDSIGYPGWCILFGWGGNNLYAYVYKTKTDKTPDFDDTNRISYGFTNKSVTGTSYESATCVMLFDANKDAASFNVHSGETIHGSDITIDDNDIDFTFFFAKDVNDDVLCGLGRLFPVRIRTPERSARTVNAPLQKSTIDTLQLTKMLNYLSPGCPEMKSAYVSVVRPLSDATEQKYVKLYEINGVKYGRASFTDSWDSKNIADHNCYYPFDPFVKY